MTRAAAVPAASRAGAALLCVAALLCGTTPLTGCSGLAGQGPEAGRSPGGAEPSATPAPSPPPPAPSDPDELQERYQQVVQDVLPSVVQITTDEQLGSGVVHDTAGHIVTNAHVVGDARTFEVTLATGGGPLKAELVAAHEDQDLAVIRLTDPPRRLRPATFGASAQVEVGQIVLAMGNPLGLSSSVTQGIVSAVGRSVSEGEGRATIGNMVQTSAAINPGNSGGALVNLAGQVIGIPTLSARDPQSGAAPAPGIGFAIPAATVRDLAGQMIRHGKVVDADKPELGVSVRTVLGEDFQPAGASVVEVAEDGGAAAAGLRPGDLVVEVDGEEIVDVVDLAEALAGHRPGDRVPVRYLRGGAEHRVTVRLGEA
ncbi:MULTISPECIES: S1C family serine protease [unclassified Streptomyces]|uniref:S1C family serine protease n=1 Tax=unclassified Streptomyces TaxID=2593676 RepID=UPI0022B6A21D|nr:MULTISPECIES: trypsin-like peptidase domain-containing protein [unclassified Streptomyces]MCZ7413876.1 trypsin-like peptidase domain-containing protein [Streptomyces sp. WMMC897]MCZ7430872.1 trypsin-like peptidase domain-containing protein [Streptomyces sp. WMMC1477]